MITVFVINVTLILLYKNFISKKREKLITKTNDVKKNIVY